MKYSREHKNAAKHVQNYGFLLMPNFSMLAFSSAIETLHMANWVSRSTLYNFCTIGQKSKVVVSNSGVKTTTDYELLGPPKDLDAIFICGASSITMEENSLLNDWLLKWDKRGLSLGGICTGGYLLANAGLLDGHRATIHWGDLASLRESFPEVLVSNHLFEVDNDRFTCSGGTAAMDMMLFLIGSQHGMNLASEISEQFVCERIRTHSDPQRIPLLSRLGTSQPKLIEAVQLMEANIGEPLSSDDIAFHVGISRRHLERLFKQNLDSVPSKYYLTLRLSHAKQLLLQTDKSIAEIGLTCGFTTAPHFSTTYKNHFGITPRQERKTLTQHAPPNKVDDRDKRRLWRAMRTS
ncbi:AraC family transcriptional regulator [Terasakiispira papahanaumokuakeensis]|uniref:AraC family transcriptional regulator n=1 Tax=Terasakiispira papahanaumokuakeensis TaxID=197479 RepID=A0A1E2V7C1_9GAMM|nr:GlxA family transcriptional regulator [Terasakiispira papahanaumokuakeensis]ODC02813.1 AraC family transcriptional regulator [Terasakiispira papahanaumokuakeensis]